MAALIRLAMVMSLFFVAPLASARSDSYSAYVTDAATGEVLHAKDANATRAPASLTKMMTLYLTLEAIEAGELALGEALPISAHAAAQPPTKLGLRDGDTIQTLDAMKGIIVRSANDAAVVLAERVGGNEDRFAAIMTDRARELGMTRTRFTNASGLPDHRQMSTARDMAQLAQALIRDYPTYYALFSLRSMTWQDQTITSHNHVLDMVNGADGMKTGYTHAARYCLATSAKRDDNRLIAVVMGAPNAASRDAYAARLLEAGFETLDARPSSMTLALNASAPAALQVPQIKPATRSDRLLNIVVEEPASLTAPPPATVPYVPAKIIATSTAPLPPVGGWSIQVGAFSSEAQADARLSALTSTAGTRLAEGRPTVLRVPDTALWRARFVGYARDVAETSCDALRGLGEACFVVAER